MAARNGARFRIAVLGRKLVGNEAEIAAQLLYVCREDGVGYEQMLQQVQSELRQRIVMRCAAAGAMLPRSEQELVLRQFAATKRRYLTFQELVADLVETQLAELDTWTR